MGTMVSRSYSAQRTLGGQGWVSGVGFFGVIVGFFGCSIQEQTLPDMSQAQGYRMLSIESFPAPEGRERYRIIIYSDGAITRDQRAHTAIRAALDLQGKAKRAYEVSVWLEALPRISERVAIADYYPYKVSSRGDEKEHIWSVEASDYQVTSGKIDTAELFLEEYLRE